MVLCIVALIASLLIVVCPVVSYIRELRDDVDYVYQDVNRFIDLS